MSRFQCPICGQEQSFQEEKEYGFCQRCGTKLLLRSGHADPNLEEENLISHLHIQMSETNAALAQTASVSHSQTQAEEVSAVQETEMPEDWEEEGEEEEKRSSLRTWLAAALAVLLILGGVTAAYFFWFKPAAEYKINVTRHNSGQYEEAIEGFVALGEYRDSRHMADVCRLDKALWELNNGRLTESVQSLNSIQDKSLDTSTYDALAGSRIQKLLMGGLDYEAALTELSLLPKGRVKDVDSSFIYAFGQSIAEGKYEAASGALEDFAPYISNQKQAADLVIQEMVNLMDNGRYQEASSLNLAFSSLLADPAEDVQNRFQAFIREEEYYRAAALLEVFESDGAERDYYENELETLLEKLLKDEKDEKAIELVYAFEHYRDMQSLLEEKTSELLEDKLEKQSWERFNSLMESFSPYNDKLYPAAEEAYERALTEKSFEEAEAMLENAESPLFNKVEWEYRLAQALLEEEELEQAEAHLIKLGKYKDSEDILTEILYQRIIRLLDEGKEEEAEELTKSLGSTAKQQQVMQEAKLRTILKLMEKPQMDPADYTNAYNTLYSIRTHEGASEKLTELLESWADIVMQNVDRRPYIQAMSGMSFISSKNRSHICQYVIEKAEPLGGHKKDGTAWTMENQWLPYNIYRFMEMVSDDSGATRAFIQYAMSMDKENIELEITDIWSLWDLRADVRELCASNEYLVVFLSGVWKSADGKARLEVSKKNKVNTVSYNVPPTKEEKNITASLFGLTGSKGRICDIKLIDYHTIELTNVADGKSYKMTRP